MPQLPQQFLNSLHALSSLDIEAFKKIHEESDRITSIRLNPFKPVELDFDISIKVPWANGAYFLSERPSFTHDPLFQAGAYYVQEAGSMFLEQALLQHLNLSASLRVLDLCAAPGGKSTLLASHLDNESLLVSNEIVRSRATLLSYQMSKWGNLNCIVTNNEPAKFSALECYFDLLVVDAPCSGSGMFRKQPEAIDEWSENAVHSCSYRQKEILEASLPALKENGILFYSTCSYSIEENEQIVQWLIANQDMEPLPLRTEESWNIVSSDYGYRFYPHLTQSEGFFCAVLRKKNGSVYQSHKSKKKQKQNDASIKSIEGIDLENNIARQINSKLHLMSPQVVDFLDAFSPNLYFKKAGVVLGELKNKGLVPDHELALAATVKHDFLKFEVDKTQALSFLRKTNVQISATEKGFVLITYKGVALGWAKLLDGRVNNYLPAEYRILT